MRRADMFCGRDGYVRIVVTSHKPFELVDGEDLLYGFDKLGIAGATPVIADICKLRSVTISLRRLMASERAAQKISSLALIVRSPVSRAIGNFFIRFNRPPFPARLCDDEASAVAFTEALPRRS
jgi:hypothetical protein